MKILYLSSEVVPFAKTGGLADVSGAIPAVLAERGHDVTVVTPYYGSTRAGDHGIEAAGFSVTVPMAWGEESAPIYFAPLGGGGTVYFIEHPFYEQGDGLYGDENGDYANNADRYALLCKVGLELARHLEEEIDVVHCNDWQTALAPIYLDLWYRRSEVLGRASSILTIHNLAYQGLFPREQLSATGLPERLYSADDGLEFYEHMSYLKGGLLYADAITTVSPRYAEEIQTKRYGHGLEGVIRMRSDRLFGIMNGIDDEIWNPETDRLIPANYTSESLSGKRKCKRELQGRCGLPQNPHVPLLGIISRLVVQKGFDLLAEVLHRMEGVDFQLVLLGTGASEYEQYFRDLASRHPEKVSANITFDNELAHWIEAGSDLFLMPSRYEPCGLNQMYSLRYGTVPVVRTTGGLADSVVDYSPHTLKEGRGNGFRFDHYSADGLEWALHRALALYPDRRKWRKLMRNGMAADFSWNRSAMMYEELYEKLAVERQGIS